MWPLSGIIISGFLKISVGCELFGEVDAHKPVFLSKQGKTAKYLDG
jgi:hypothetical protein